MENIFKFNDEIHDYQRFVRENITKLGSLVIISEQILIKDIEKGFIDILALDISTQQIVVLELKNSPAGDDIVGQSIKYYDFLIRAKDDLRDILAKMQNQFNFAVEDVNLIPRIMLIVPDFSHQLIRSLSYINEIEIDVVKFNAVQRSNYYEVIKEVYVPTGGYREDAVVKLEGELTKSWNFNEYLNVGIDERKVLLAKQFVSYTNRIYQSRGKPMEVYFYKDKITLMTGKKVIAQAKLAKTWFDNSLDITVSIPKEKKVNIASLMYNCNILNFNIMNTKIKIKCAQLPIDVLKEIL